MANITFTDSKTPITNKEIEEYEEELQCKFPQEYKNFLLEHNGGVPEPSGFVPLLQEEASEAVDFFLSIHGDTIDDMLNVVKNLEELFESVHITTKQFIPIALDSFNNVILLSVAGKDAGHVYFLSSDNEDFSALPDQYARDDLCKNCKCMYLINYSFEDWLNTFTDDINEIEDDDDGFGVDIDNLDEEGQKELKKKTLELIMGHPISDEDLEAFLNGKEIDFGDIEGDEDEDGDGDENDGLSGDLEDGQDFDDEDDDNDDEEEQEEDDE